MRPIFARSAFFAAFAVAFAAPGFAASFAYVPNQASGTVSVIDTGKDEVGRGASGCEPHRKRSVGKAN